jgi:hypothetical protein
MSKPRGERGEARRMALFRGDCCQTPFHLEKRQKGMTESSLRHFDPYLRLKRGEQKDFWREIRQFLRATFRGEVMRQFGVEAKICVSKQRNIRSHYAQFTGEIMRQKWRSYGISHSKRQA